VKNITGQVETTGNISSLGATSMGIDGDGIGHIMSVLSNQYSNRTLAVIREYACNAWDSHIEAFMTHRPIEVTLPGDWGSNLIIRDFGTGLTKDEIIKVFGTYGASTKRDSDEQVGALGIGSKAAFTMGSQFIVTGRKDGFEAKVLFALNDDHVGQMTVLSEGLTDEPNGVEVNLPVKSVRETHSEAYKFFATWKPGTVLVDGQAPESFFEHPETTTLDDTTWYTTANNRVRVLMGTVAYPVSEDIMEKVAGGLQGDAHRLANVLSNGYSRKVGVLFEVPIGAVNIAPSREALSDTSRTLKAIREAVTKAAATLTRNAQIAVDTAGSYFEASRVRKDQAGLLEMFGFEGDDLTYQGKSLGEVKTDLFGYGMVKRYYNRATMVVGDPQKDFVIGNAYDADRVLVVTGVEKPEKPLRGLKKMLEEHPEVPKYVLQTSKSRGKVDWFSFGKTAPVKTWTVDEFKAQLRSLRVTPDGKPRVSEAHYTEGFGAEREVEDRTPLSEILEYGDPILYFEDGWTEHRRWLSNDALVKAATKGYTVITLYPTQSENALLKRVPEAVYGPKVLQEYAASQAQSLSEDDMEILKAKATMSNYENNALRNWRNRLAEVWDDITNETFLAPFRALADAEEIVDLYEDRLAEIESLSRWNVVSKDVVSGESLYVNIEEHWPLLKAIDSYYARRMPKAHGHAVTYINSTSPIAVCPTCEVTEDDCECGEEE